jgi:hypothetical protein
VAHRQIVLTWDPEWSLAERYWLTRDYLPEAATADRGFAALPEILDVLGPAQVQTLLIPHDCTDGFFRAYWRRPDAYLDPSVRASISALALLDDRALQPGLEQLAADLKSGTWQQRNAELLNQDALDVGYRLVVSTSP